MTQGSTQWSRVDRYRYWRKVGSLDLFVTLNEDALWQWEAFQFHKRLMLSSNGYRNHRHAMNEADRWTEREDRSRNKET